MRFKECLIAWNPNSNQVKVGPWPDPYNWSGKYTMTGGAANLDVRSMETVFVMARMLYEFWMIVTVDRVDLDAVHNAFMAIDKYAKMVKRDMYI